ncbi:MAG: HEAT repeat domain-containing protein [Gemmataceae bacterium]
MRTLFGLLALSVGLGLGGLAWVVAAPVSTVDEQKQIEQLIDLLGNGSFVEREEATSALEKIGAPALEALRKAAQSDDVETRKRASELVNKISQKMTAANLLAPTRVHLKYDNMPVLDAVRDLAQKSGYNIVLTGNPQDLAERRVTLDTGETTFWQAFDLFCQKAGLTEATDKAVKPQPRPQPVPRPLPIRPLPQPAPQPAPVPLPAPVPNRQPLQNGALQQRIQIQVQPGQPIQGVAPAILPVQPPERFPGAANQTIYLTDGKPPVLPTHYEGAVRVRALPPSTPINDEAKKDSEEAFVLDVTPEPKLMWQQLLGVRVDRAIDDQGQKLSASTSVGAAEEQPAIGIGVAPAIARIRPPLAVGHPTQITVRLAKGDKPSQSLKEIRGTITAQAQTAPQPLITVANILKAAGQTVRGQDGGEIKVIDVTQQANGQITVQVAIEPPANALPVQGGVGNLPIQVQPLPAPVPAQRQAQPQPAPPAQQFQVQQIQVQIGGRAPVLPTNPAGLSLVDDKDQPFRLVSTGSKVQIVNNVVSQEYTLTYQPNQGQGAPTKLILSGSRSVSLDIPFVLKDVPLK